MGFTARKGALGNRIAFCVTVMVLPSGSWCYCLGLSLKAI